MSWKDKLGRLFGAGAPPVPPGDGRADAAQRTHERLDRHGRPSARWSRTSWTACARAVPARASTWRDGWPIRRMGTVAY